MANPAACREYRDHHNSATHSADNQVAACHPIGRVPAFLVSHRARRSVTVPTIWRDFPGPQRIRDRDDDQAGCETDNGGDHSLPSKTLSLPEFLNRSTLILRLRSGQAFDTARGARRTEETGTGCADAQLSEVLRLRSRCSLRSG